MKSTCCHSHQLSALLKFHSAKQDTNVQKHKAIFNFFICVTKLQAGKLIAEQELCPDLTAIFIACLIVTANLIAMITTKSIFTNNVTERFTSGIRY